jgi:hypothetical protein
LEIAEEFGLDPSKVHFGRPGGGNTGFVEAWDILFVYPDVLPAAGNAARANSRISMRGTLGHELLGHRAAGQAGRSFAPQSLLDEVQASVRAARHTPGLTSIERITLLEDALERLRDAGVRWRDIRGQLFLD